MYFFLTFQLTSKDLRAFEIEHGILCFILYMHMHRDTSFLKKRDSFELERLSMAFSILRRMSDPKMVKDSCLRIMTSTCLLPVQRHT